MSTSLAQKLHGERYAHTVETVRNLLERVPLSAITLAFRIAVAVVFWRSGMTKIANWDLTVALFENEYALPLLPPTIAAYLGTFAELACPVLLVLGLGTRVAAAALLGMTLVIQLFVFPENWPDHLLWGSILAYLVTRGGGAISLDAVISRAVFGSR